MCLPVYMHAHQPIASLLEYYGDEGTLLCAVGLQSLCSGVHWLRSWKKKDKGPHPVWAFGLVYLQTLPTLSFEGPIGWPLAALALVLTSLGSRVLHRRGRVLTPAGWLVLPSLAVGIGAMASSRVSMDPVRTATGTLIFLGMAALWGGIVCMLLSFSPRRTAPRIALRWSGVALLLCGGFLESRRAMAQAWLKDSATASMFEQAQWNGELGWFMLWALLAWTVLGLLLRRQHSALQARSLPLLALCTTASLCVAVAVIELPGVLQSPQTVDQPRVGGERVPFPNFARPSAVLEASYLERSPPERRRTHRPQP